MLSETSETQITHLCGIIKQLNSLSTLQQSHVCYFTQKFAGITTPKNKDENAILFIVYEAQYYVVGLQLICLSWYRLRAGRKRNHNLIPGKGEGLFFV